MSGTFTATTDVAHDLVQYRLEGFFEPSDLPAIQRARREAHARLRCGPQQHVVLCDATAASLQSQEMVRMFAALIEDRTTLARRLAFVTGDAAIRMQIRRLAASEPERIAVFHDRADAEAWLLRLDTSKAA